MKIFNNYYNPFREIFESETYPYAQTYRNNAKQKFKKAFRVISGNGLFFDVGTFATAKQLHENHIGIFDYLTLGIPFLLSRLTQSVLEKQDEIKKFPDGAAAKYSWGLFDAIAAGAIQLIWLTTYAARNILAAVVTFIASPIIAAVALKTSNKHKQLWDQAGELLFRTKEPIPGTKERENERRLKRIIEEKVAPESIPVCEKDIHAYWRLKHFGQISLGLSKYEAIENFDADFICSDNKVQIHLTNIKNPEATKPTLVSTDIDLVDGKLPGEIQAFVELNFGHVAEKLEKRGFFKKKGNIESIDTTLDTIPSPSAAK